MGTSYVSKLLKPESFADLKRWEQMPFSREHLRAPTVPHEQLDEKILNWVKVARASFEVRIPLRSSLQSFFTLTSIQIVAVYKSQNCKHS